MAINNLGVYRVSTLCHTLGVATIIAQWLVWCNHFTSVFECEHVQVSLIVWSWWSSCCVNNVIVVDCRGLNWKSCWTCRLPHRILHDLKQIIRIYPFTFLFLKFIVSNLKHIMWQIDWDRTLSHNVLQSPQDMHGNAFYPYLDIICLKNWTTSEGAKWRLGVTHAINNTRPID